jgi:hypothetical protein
MKAGNRWRTRIVVTYAVMTGFAIPHLIDDFLYGVPAEFGLTNVQAQLLAAVFSIVLIAIVALAARDQRSGYLGAGFMGGFLALAGILRHLPRIVQPGPYWGGWFSESLIFGLVLSGLVLVYAVGMALREQGRPSPPG